MSEEANEGIPSYKNPPKGPKDCATSIDDQIRYAFFTPAPTEYDIHYSKSTKGGLISSSVFPSLLDEPAKLVADVPGPSQYLGPGDFPVAEGGRVYAPNPPRESELDKSLLNDAPGPGPGHFNLPETKKNQTLGTFAKDIREPKYINDEVKRTEENPPVGYYNSQEAQEFIDPFLPAGGAAACNQHKPASYFDDVVKPHLDVPDPTKYAVHGTMELKPTGKPQCKYVSDTLEESRKLVRQALSSEVPGPGAYSLPDLPAGKSCSLPGRALGHAMPGPYNYNSQPDLCRKFAPVRKGNSGDLIFGRNFRKDADGVMIRKSPADAPAAICGPSSPSAGSSVRSRGHSITSDASDAASSSSNIHKGWVEGGFEKAQLELCKSRSVPAIQKPMHVSVAKAAQFYAPLSGHMQKPSSTFLPMAARRCVAVHTDPGTRDYTEYLVAKKSLQIIAEDLGAATKAALHPVDQVEVFRDAERLLARKARAQLRVEGLPTEKMLEVTDASSRYLKQLLGMGPTPPLPPHRQVEPNAF